MRPHPRRARTDPRSPRGWATDDRSGFVGNHENLCWQYEWAGTGLVNKRILVYRDQLDVPNRQLGTLIIPPDPVPLMNARPEQYPIDEYWDFLWEGSNALMQQEGTEAEITFEYSQYFNTTYVAPS